MKWLRAYAWALLVFLWAPLLFVLGKGASPDAFQKLFLSNEILTSLEHSALLAGGTAFLCTLFGLAIAFALPALSPRLRSFVAGSLLLPMVLPEIAFGLAYLVWYQTLGLSLGWGTLLFSHVGFALCYSVLVLRGSVSRLDSSLADAARDLGAGPLAIFRHAILPQVMPGLIASAFLAFSLSLDDFLITFFVKGIDQITLPIKIFSMMRLRLGPEVYALSVLLFGISLVSVLMAQLWFKKSPRS